MAILIILGCSRWALPVSKDITRERFLVFVLLVLATILFSQTPQFNLPNDNIYPIPGIPADPLVPVIFLLIDLPWILAAGFVGAFWSVLLGVLAGGMVALTNTHQLFTIVEYAGLALVFNLFYRQRYRGLVYRLLHHPVGTAVFVGSLYILVYIISALFATPGPIAARIDYAFTQNWLVILARSVELFLAAVIGEVLYVARVPFWHRSEAVELAPEETSLRARILLGSVPLVVILFLTLTVGDWVVAGGTARRMIHDRLSSTAQVAVESLPYFLETGQNLLITLATPDLATATPDQARALLETRLRSIPFFRQLQLFDKNMKVVNGYPARLEESALTAEENAAVTMAMNGVFTQNVIVPAVQGENSVQVAFISPIFGKEGKPVGVLLGRTDLTNQFTLPALNAMSGIKDWNGEGMILDENGMILYHPIAAYVGDSYGKKLPEQAEFFDDVSDTGTRRLVYYQPMIGNRWAVLLSVPAEQVQSASLEIASPLLIILLILSTLFMILLAISLGAVTGSLRSLSSEVGMISRGQLDHPLAVRGDDEVGRLGQAFEQMRMSLKARLDELNRLLKVSQGVAGSLKVEQALPPVLDAVLTEEVAAVRVVLTREVTLDQDGTRPIVLGRGPLAEAFAYLDDQIFELVGQQPLLSIPNMNRVRLLTIPPGALQPGSLIALALVQDNHYFGALWVAYNKPHNFSEAEVRFLGTIAGQAALAAANARLYSSAEIGRQRLSAVLASSPEPVLVIDEKNRLLLMNPAASQTTGLIVAGDAGRPIREVLANLDLLELLTQPNDEKLASREITLPGNQVFSASVSPVIAGNRLVGRVCVLQDITHYKELDTLKSDFVATVSHDLRSPLTLMRGYATMLQMVGELNDQQKNFQKKILTGVENMTRLVNNLLDLGRLEAGISLQVEQVNVQEIISQVLTALQPNAIQKNIQVEHDSLTLPPIFLDADRALLQQAITNLVDNAIKYTQVGGKVTVSLQTKPTSLVFCVKDTGIGVAPLDLPRLFEKFYRSARREAHAQKGSGMGLAIVKSIAERHSGKVFVESQLGKGSSFYMEIPMQARK